MGIIAGLRKSVYKLIDKYTPQNEKQIIRDGVALGLVNRMTAFVRTDENPEGEVTVNPFRRRGRRYFEAADLTQRLGYSACSAELQRLAAYLVEGGSVSDFLQIINAKTLLDEELKLPAGIEIKWVYSRKDHSQNGLRKVTLNTNFKLDETVNKIRQLNKLWGNLLLTDVADHHSLDYHVSKSPRVYDGREFAHASKCLFAGIEPSMVERVQKSYRYFR
jgi:hypothetical protein